MTYAESILLGALQGATEFLPVSSSGHLRLGEAALDIHFDSIVFDVALHLGTLVAVIVVYRHTIARLLRAPFQHSDQPFFSRPGTRAWGFLMLATVPTGLIAILLSKVLAPDLSIAVVGGLLLVNGGILLSSKLVERERAPDPYGHGEAPPPAAPPQDDFPADWGLTPAKAFLIGVVQGIAVLPGISRSGTTITTALFCGVRPKAAAEFSFLLSIPAILGAGLKTASDLEHFDQSEIVIIGLGVLTSVVVGVIALKLLIRLVSNARFHTFAWYCFALGAIALGLAR
ncbi:MAG: undecaprenyl-diphosphate phosphatase [Myxococcales bacterium]|nr:undecaprenyl-diphosphate phosphatase [Myxococcales bacterium]